MLRIEGDTLMSVLWHALSPEEKRPDLALKVVDERLLGLVLELPKFNLSDFAPGTPESDAALAVCGDIRAGRATLEQLRAWANDVNLDPALRAGVRFEYASYLGNEGLKNPPLIEEAIAEWRKVLQLYSRSSHPRRWAISCLELAQSYSHRKIANPAANAREAMRLLDVSLEILTADRYPEDFALAQSRRANLLLDMSSAPTNIAQSLSAFEAALTVYSKDSYPIDWAVVLSNMATAYLTRGGYSNEEDLYAAIAALEASLTVRTRQDRPFEWALTQMNLGLALSRLAESENPFGRAVDALRLAYEVFGELGDKTHQLNAAHNLGLTLARSRNLSLAKEACDRLEESLPWLEATGQREVAEDALGLLAWEYRSWLRSENNGASGEAICRRALNVFKGRLGGEGGTLVYCEVGIWLLRHVEGDPERMELAGRAFEEVLPVLRPSENTGERASVLANLATVLLARNNGSRESDRLRAMQCMDEAVRLLRSLPSTPEIQEQIGFIAMNRIRNNLEN
jgi:tetratricopeptide (TPR) repeat protein